MFPLLLVAAAVASRLIPDHPHNFACLGAAGLLAGARLRGWTAWSVPVASLLISDALIGFYPPLEMTFTYVATILSVALGRLILAGPIGFRRVGAVALLNSCIFFAISNIGPWLMADYDRTPAGLLTCYVNALPFFQNTVLSDLCYCGLLFGGYEAVSRWGARRQGLPGRLQRLPSGAGLRRPEALEPTASTRSL